ncbi:unnamed protein product [Strongylus vulgaris]|uniref:Uncharacterized protein n=1 Tax=Strongylus vulgaris TaxID=40348 RepID=A0A3P7JTH9_STRVU|nr:unnamed protein product [Strongylus vulgaris]
MQATPSAPPDVEQAGPKANLQFSNQTIRSRFVSKVFTLVTIMFTIVTIMCAMPFIIPSFKDWIQNNLVFFFVSL